MLEVNIHEAKTHLSRLLEAALAGEEVIIARAGTPIVRLVPVAPATRTPGLARGHGNFDESFFDPLPDSELGLWER